MASDARNHDRLKVLIVDDEVALAETMAEALERTGYDVALAHSGAEGLKLIERVEPSVILTDLKMEGMDGLTLLKKAKQELPDAEVPAAVAELRLRVAPVSDRPWPPSWFGAASGSRPDTAARSEELLKDGFGRSA